MKKESCTFALLSKIFMIMKLLHVTKIFGKFYFKNDSLYKKRNLLFLFFFFILTYCFSNKFDLNDLIN
jgi:hypothetical protein